jgi:hypothetical protein
MTATRTKTQGKARPFDRVLPTVPCFADRIDSRGVEF